MDTASNRTDSSGHQLAFCFEPPDARRKNPTQQEGDKPSRHVRVARAAAKPASTAQKRPDLRATLGPGATLLDLLTLILTDDELTERRQRDLASSVRSFARYLNLDLTVRADFPTFRDKVARFSAAGARVSKGRWANIRSDLAFALNRYRARRGHGGPKALLPAWRTLRDKIDDDRLLRGLSRLMHWASRQQLLPDQIDDPAMQAFHRHLTEETLESKPDRIYRDTCKLWNDAVAQVPSWPKRSLTLPSFRKTVSLPVDAFPASFWADFQRYRRARLGTDLATATGYDRSAKASTLDHQEYQLRRFASTMVRVGRQSDELGDLSSLFDRPWFERAIQDEHDRLGGPCPSLQELAATLITIGRRYVDLPEERLDELTRIKRRLGTRSRGFTERNRERLRQFRDPRNQAAFLHLRERLLAEAKRTTPETKRALRVQTALMHEILLVAPMRMENLTTLNLNHSFRFSRRGRAGTVHIVVPGRDVKNGRDLEFELPEDTAGLLRRYLDNERLVLLHGEDAGWLFPGIQPGTHKHQVTLSGQLAKALAKHTGLAVNPHLYRHVAAFFYLQAHPGELETVRRLLGHSSLQTTTMFYAEIDGSTASRLYAKHLLERRLDDKRTSDRTPRRARRGGGLR